MCGMWLSGSIMNCVCGKRQHWQFNVYWQQVQCLAYYKPRTLLLKGRWWSAFQCAYACTSNGWVHLSSELHLNASRLNHFYTSWLNLNTSWLNHFHTCKWYTACHFQSAFCHFILKMFMCASVCACMHACVVISHWRSNQHDHDSRENQCMCSVCV